MNVSGELANALARLIQTGRSNRPFLGFANEDDAVAWCMAMMEAKQTLAEATATRLATRTEI